MIRDIDERDLDEMIADAKAEEEANNDFRSELKSKLDEAFKPTKDTKVCVSLKEYVSLQQQAADLHRILSAIVDGLSLNYSKSGLRYDGDLENVIKVLYPETYEDLLSKLLAEKEGE